MGKSALVEVRLLLGLNLPEQSARLVPLDRGGSHPWLPVYPGFPAGRQDAALMAD